MTTRLRHSSQVLCDSRDASAGLGTRNDDAVADAPPLTPSNGDFSSVAYHHVASSPTQRSYAETLAFMCRFTGLSVETTVGFEFTGAHYCRVLHVCCPSLVDVNDVCWNPTPIGAQEHDNLALFLGACATLEVETFPVGLSPSSLRPVIQQWTQHALVQHFLYRLAITNCVSCADDDAVGNAVESHVPPHQPRCESGVMQIAKELAAHGGALGPSSQPQASPFATPVPSAAPSLRCSQEEQRQPGAPSIVSLWPQQQTNETMDMHAPDEHLDALTMERRQKAHLLQQLQLRAYRHALRDCKKAFLEMLANAGSAGGSAATIAWDTLEAKVHVPPEHRLRLDTPTTTS
jgi:hypothetical protein